MNQEAATLAQTLRDARDAARLGTARTALRTKVGDHSNLILDNVLDTYYLTDVVLNRLPDLFDRLADIGALAAAQGTSARRGRTSLLLRMGFRPCWTT